MSIYGLEYFACYLCKPLQFKRMGFREGTLGEKGRKFLDKKNGYKLKLGFMSRKRI